MNCSTGIIQLDNKCPLCDYDKKNKYGKQRGI